MKEFYTIKENSEHTIEIKKSSFTCFLIRVTSEEEAKKEIDHLKKLYWKANHHCSAFVIGEKRGLKRSSDDGEPSGTAGVPILEILDKNELTNTLAVVVRFFGGTKLGSGGLIRAYSRAVSEAIKENEVVQVILQKEVRLIISYAQLDSLQYFLAQSSYLVALIEYTEKVTLFCQIPEKKVPQFKKEVVDFLQNQCELVEGELDYAEIPYQSE